MISPSFVIPFLMIPLGAWLHILTGNFWLLQALGLVMTLYGLYVCYLMLRRPEELAVEANHVSRGSVAASDASEREAEIPFQE